MMRRIVACGVCAAVVFVAGDVRPVLAAASCESLMSLTSPNVQITSATAVGAGPLTVGRGAMTVPDMCRVQVLATPTADSRIAIEVWLPPALAWNGRLLGTDNGGFSGAIGDQAIGDRENCMSRTAKGPSSVSNRRTVAVP